MQFLIFLTRLFPHSVILSFNFFFALWNASSGISDHCSQTTLFLKPNSSTQIKAKIQSPMNSLKKSTNSKQRTGAPSQILSAHPSSTTATENGGVDRTLFRPITTEMCSLEQLRWSYLQQAHFSWFLAVKNCRTLLARRRRRRFGNIQRTWILLISRNKFTAFKMHFQ